MALDGHVLLMARPGPRRAFGASAAQLQWTSTGYLVAVAALLVLAGRLGDRDGHLRLLRLGLTGFGLASAGIALAPSAGRVIGPRVAQGVCGALLQPATLAVLRPAYPGKELRRAVAVRTGAIAVAAGSGPVLGGLLVAHFGRQSVFWISLPLVLAAVVPATAMPLPERDRPVAQRLGLAGAVLPAAVWRYSSTRSHRYRCAAGPRRTPCCSWPGSRPSAWARPPAAFDGAGAAGAGA
ncbi:MFS transporter [Streptomyces sp. PVA_94-07]|uniref:MFS transporter n=1 Tax=Streptomyces sp. PVA_94-07 TaxID=1225337 RepID=UPI000A503C60